MSPAHHGDDQGDSGGQVEQPTEATARTQKATKATIAATKDRPPAPANRGQPDTSQQHRQGKHTEHAHAIGLDQGDTQLALWSPTTRRLDPPIGAWLQLPASHPTWP